MFSFFSSLCCFKTQVNAEDGKQATIKIYGQTVTIEPSVVNALELEGGPEWKDVRYLIPEILPDAFQDGEVQSFDEILASISRFESLYSDLTRREIKRLAVRFVDSHPRFPLAGERREDNPDFFAHFENYVLKQDKEYQVDFMDTIISDLIKSENFSDIIDDYNSWAEDRLLKSTFSNAKRNQDIVYALGYFMVLLKESPEYKAYKASP